MRIIYSIEFWNIYVESNLVGFVSILEACRNYHLKHFVYASEIFIKCMALIKKMPFSENEMPKSSIHTYYFAIKKSNELLAHTYSYLFKLPTTGFYLLLWSLGSSNDIFLFKFTKAIINNEKIDVFNNGNHTRDFTYIDYCRRFLVQL